jgi:hypothetical protein
MPRYLQLPKFGLPLLLTMCWLLTPQGITHADVLTVTVGNSAQVPKQPQAAVDASGAVHVVYGIADDVFYSRSDAIDTRFSSPQKAFAVPNMSLGMRRGPRICVTGETIVVTAIGGKQGRGRDGDLLSWTSENNGETWSGPGRVNDVESSAREGLHAMAAGTAGVVWCVWLDLRDPGTAIYCSRSDDGGKTWGPNKRAYSSPEKSVCECCHPSAYFHGKTLIVMFRNSLAGNRDMFVTTSVDNGETFTKAEQLGRGHWKLNACPMDGGMLATGPGGQLMTVWRREGSVYCSTGNEREQLLGQGNQPWIAANENGSLIAWTSDRIGDLLVQRAGNEAPALLAREAQDPIVVCGPKSDKAIVFWEGRQRSQPAILAESVTLKAPGKK